MLPEALVDRVEVKLSPLTMDAHVTSMSCLVSTDKRFLLEPAPYELKPIKLNIFLHIYSFRPNNELLLCVIDVGTTRSLFFFCQ